MTRCFLINFDVVIECSSTAFLFLCMHCHVRRLQIIRNCFLILDAVSVWLMTAPCLPWRVAQTCEIFLIKKWRFSGDRFLSRFFFEYFAFLLHNKNCLKAITNITQYNTTIYSMLIAYNQFQPYLVSSGRCKRQTIIKLLRINQNKFAILLCHLSYLLWALSRKMYIGHTALALTLGLQVFC